MSLEEYSNKRDFQKTPEPAAFRLEAGENNRFVIQRHQARRLHFDLRLEIDGVLKSWAIPKGPSMNPRDKRLSVQTEDHPIGYLTFHGTIPKGNYGAGTMTIWDQGTFEVLGDPKEQLSRGDLKIHFLGNKIKGTFALVKTNRGGEERQWLLIKKKDNYSTDLVYDANNFLSEASDSVLSGSFKEMLKPMLASSIREPFSKAGWIYEIKWDGYRLMSHIDQGIVEMYSRNGISYKDKFRVIWNALRNIPHQAILDGEVVILNDNGIPDFQKLQHYNEEETIGEIRYYVFDLLFLNGESILHLPLTDRKSLIPALIEDIPFVYYCDHVNDWGVTYFEKAIEAGLEGILAKKASSSYDPGLRTENWLKIKAYESQEAIICGYTHSDGAPFGSLIFGVYENDDLKYIGNCGSGFSNAQQIELLHRFRPLEQKQRPFEQPLNLKGKHAVWLKPELICEVKFSMWTNAGMMRHPVFKALREDKFKHEIKKDIPIPGPEKPVKGSISESFLEVDGVQVPISNLEKLYWPDEGISKYQVLDYYIHTAAYILPYMVNRPQNLHRHPNGIHQESFYQKDTSGIFPHWVQSVQIFSESSNKEIQYLLCQNEATLLYMANLGCIELNPWSSRTPNLDFPDYTVIDLDPSPKNSFEEIILVAQAIKEIHDDAGIISYCKTSGSKGLHIYIPLGGKYTYEEGRDFTKLLCYLINARLPDLTTMERKVDKRNGRIYLDYLQNLRGQTLAAPYCLRPKPGATVSAPLDWDEVRPGLRMADYNIDTMGDRLKTKGDLFAPLLVKQNNIEKILEKLDL
jgi:bifunctional non-homologous end joining protein LigD